MYASYSFWIGTCGIYLLWCIISWIRVLIISPLPPLLRLMYILGPGSVTTWSRYILVVRTLILLISTRIQWNLIATNTAWVVPQVVSIRIQDHMHTYINSSTRHTGHITRTRPDTPPWRLVNIDINTENCSEAPTDLLNDPAKANVVPLLAYLDRL